jgi:hypothetical protein
MEKQPYITEQRFNKIIKLISTCMQSLSESQVVTMKMVMNACETLSASDKEDLSKRIDSSTKILNIALQTLNDLLPQ